DLGPVPAASCVPTVPHMVTILRRPAQYPVDPWDCDGPARIFPHRVIRARARPRPAGQRLARCRALGPGANPGRSAHGLGVRPLNGTFPNSPFELPLPGPESQIRNGFAPGPVLTPGARHGR